MKLKKRPLGLSEIKRRAEQSRTFPGKRPFVKAAEPRKPKASDAEMLQSMDAFLKEQEAKNEQRANDAKASPVIANAAGLGYTGPLMPDKGKRDGSCNVTACQMPLAGFIQYVMPGNGNAHYCATCERRMSEWDDQIKTPRRCVLVEG
jgi:hypothetical protein